MVALAVTVIAGQRAEILVEALMPQAHLVTERIAPGDDTPSGLSAALPVVHIVLLERSRRPEHSHTRQSNGLLDLWRGRLVGEDPSPDFGLVGPPRVPDPKRPRRRAQHREVGEDRADDRLDAIEAWAEALSHLRNEPRLVGQDLRSGRVGDRVGANADDAVAVARRQHHPIRVRTDAKVAAGAGLDRREVAPRGVVAVAAEVLGRELPIARHDPFVHAADHLHTTLAPVEE